ncbi:MAG: cupin domain-containing protein [Prolixibacteraceae bacterium]|nr:cupin domain-containing protein [Prolixibacteraceae bacterium]
MATILKATQRDFQESPNKIDPYRIFTDVSRVKKGLNPENLNFDLRQLNPDEFSTPYHFHRYAEELFMILSGAATLRTPNGLEIVNSGDLIFFEKGESGAHQLYNHTTEPCVYLDIRTYMGYDIAEYPDSNKMLLAPSFEIFNKNMQAGYFDGESDIKDKWKQLEKDHLKSRPTE